MSLAEKYRPKTFDEMIGQDYAKKIGRELVERYKKGELLALPHMLLWGPAGTGKTTYAYVLANETGIPIVEYNASDERGVEFVETKLKRIAFSRGRKIVLLDEADYMTPNAQAMLRRILEEVEAIAIKTQGKTFTTFILTANYPWRIIDPIASRCVQIPFERLPRKEIAKRLVTIVKKEGITVQDENELKILYDVINTIIEETEGDMRQALKRLEVLIGALRGKRITPDIVKLVIQPDLPDIIFKLVLDGEIYKAIREIEDAVIMNKITPMKFLIKMAKLVVKWVEENDKNLNDKDKLLVLSILIEIKNVERDINAGNSPLIQLIGLITYMWEVFHQIKR